MPTDACEFDHPHDAHPCGKRIKRIKWSEVLVKKRSKDPDNWDAGVKAALDELTRMAEDDTLEEPMTEDAHKVEPVELDSLIGVPGPLMTPPRPSDHIERLEALGGLADQLGATLFEAMEFLVARDEMNAKIHMADPRWSPLTVLCREGVERWRNWKIDDGVEDSPIVEAAPYVGCSDEEALAWLMAYRNTTVIPPLAVLRTMNEIRVAAGEPPYPLRCEECCGPLDAEGWHQSEFADCSRIRGVPDV